MFLQPKAQRCGNAVIERDMGIFHKKNPPDQRYGGFRDRCLTMSYSHMGRPHTTIGAKWFHF